MKHSPKKLENFGETCTSMEIFSEFVGEGRRRIIGSWLKVHDYLFSLGSGWFLWLQPFSASKRLGAFLSLKMAAHS